MEVTKTQKSQKRKFICDATGVKMVDFSMKNSDKMIGGILSLNSNYCGIADGLDLIGEPVEFHFSAEVALDIMKYLTGVYPQFAENETAKGVLEE